MSKITKSLFKIILIVELSFSLMSGSVAEDDFGFYIKLKKIEPLSIYQAFYTLQTMNITQIKVLGWTVFDHSLKNYQIPIIKLATVPKEVYIDSVEYKNVIFQNNIINIKLNEQIIHSANWKYILLARRSKIEKISKIYNQSGKCILSQELYYPIAISNNGYIASVEEIGEYPPKYFMIFNEKGILCAKFENLIEGEGNIVFTKNGYIIIGATDLYEKSYCLLLSSDGKLLWKCDLPFASNIPKEAEIIDNIGIVTVGINYGPPYQIHACFINWDGKIQWKIPLEIRGDMIVKIIPESNQVFIASTEGYIWCIELNNGKILWKHKENWSPIQGQVYPFDVPNFYEMHIIKNNIYILCRYINADGKWYNSLLYGFNKNNGRLHSKMNFENHKVTILGSINNKDLLLSSIDSRELLIVGCDYDE